MRELTKVLCVVVLIFGAPLATVAWFDDRLDFPQPVILFLKFACPVLCVFAVALFLKIHFRPDEVPDYFARRVGAYFNRDGFCFGILPDVADGCCVFDVYFQSQYENRCVARIAMRPARGFFLGRAKIDSIVVELDCEPAAFGVARLIVPLPATLQGRRQSIEVGASVEYPEGKGRRLRFRDGITLRANSNFGNAFHTGLTVASVLTGHIQYMSPVAAALELPKGVAEEIPEWERLASIDILWKLGDPPLSEAEHEPA
jgi:hypothetical protein